MSNMEWLDVWEVEPPRNEEILFASDGYVSLGYVQGEEKLRKCIFYDSVGNEEYSADTNTNKEYLVTHWMPLPKAP